MIRWCLKDAAALCSYGGTISRAMISGSGTFLSSCQSAAQPFVSVAASFLLASACGGTLGGNPEAHNDPAGDTQISIVHEDADDDDIISDFPDASPPGLRVYLTDAPATDIKSLTITVERLEAKTANGWKSLILVSEPKFDLMKLQSGSMAALAASEDFNGDLQELRLVLSPSAPPELILADGERAELKIPRAAQSGIKIKTAVPVSSVDPRLLLDFDISRSLHRRGRSNRYILSPIIIPQSLGGSGQVVGFGFSSGSQVCFFQEADAQTSPVTDCASAEAVAWASAVGGWFKVAALTPGNFLMIILNDGAETHRQQVEVRNRKKTLVKAGR